MLDTKTIAIDIMNKKLDMADLVQSPQFLSDIDYSIVTLAKTTSNWSDVHIASVRYQLLQQINKLTN